ncbi:MAG: hypothetical protein QNK04_26915 [Myxococcota bacterium]|nr:hypothetical protein [Myxococcota bacterium]
MAGLPAALVVGGPVQTLNVALCVITWVAALAMYFLVRDWTGLPAAGIVAVLRPPWLGLEPRVAYTMHALAPDPEAVAFFRSLEARGSRGPLLAVPTSRDHVAARSERASAWRLPGGKEVSKEGDESRPPRSEPSASEGR